MCKYYVGSVYVGGYVGLSESGLCVFRELCPVNFLVVCESPLVLLLLLLLLSSIYIAQNSQINVL